MPTSTSGDTFFSLDVDEIVEQATEYVKGDWTSGVEQERARRALNLLLIELQNKKVPLHKIGTVSVPLIDGTAGYALGSPVSDVLEGTLKTTSTKAEKTLNRWGLREYHEIPNKTQEQEPTLFTTERHADLVTVKFWPVPDTTSKWTAELLVIKKIEDITAAYQRVDLPYRYYPLLVAWLAYKLSLTREGIDELTKTRLKNDLNEIMNDTFDEDGERVDFAIVPGGISGRG
jgi:hypothetical protein